MNYRIYLADDDKLLLNLYAIKFKNAGHEVKEFNGGEELLTFLRDEEMSPDAILLDVIMPGMTGLETIEMIRKENLAAESKIIVLSNQGQNYDNEQAKNLSIDGYIMKAESVPSEVLTETIKIIEKGSKNN